MLETINALKTNNSRKIPNYDPSLLEHMRRLLRGLVRSKGMLIFQVSIPWSWCCLTDSVRVVSVLSGPADENQLKISLSDLLLADQQGQRKGVWFHHPPHTCLSLSPGRWWVVGSAWTGRESSSTADSSSGTTLLLHVSSLTSSLPTIVGGVSHTAESWVLELARKQRMNTDVRKNIFCVLMTSEVGNKWWVFEIMETVSLHVRDLLFLSLITGLCGCFWEAVEAWSEGQAAERDHSCSHRLLFTGVVT